MARPARKINNNKDQETITCAAFSFNGATWALGSEKDHMAVRRYMSSSLSHLESLEGAIPGYKTSKNRFVTLDEGAAIATAAGQIL